MTIILSYSTLGFFDFDIEIALDAIAAAGFRAVELMGHPPHLDPLPAGRAVSQFRRRLEQRGFVGWTMHSPLRRHCLGATDEEWRREVSARAMRYIEFAGAIGASGLIMHPVPNPMFAPDSDAPDTPARMRLSVERSLDELTPVLERAGLRLLLENLPYRCNFPYLTMAELRSLVEGYPPAALGLAMDTGHASTLLKDPAAEIRVAGDRLAATHLHSVDAEAPDDQHWPPEQGCQDWDAIRAALLDIHYAGMWTFEVAHGKHEESEEELLHMTYAWATRWVDSA